MPIGAAKLGGPDFLLTRQLSDVRVLGKLVWNGIFPKSLKHFT